MPVIYSIHDNIVTLRYKNGGYEEHDIRECSFVPEVGDSVIVSQGDIPVIIRDDSVRDNRTDVNKFAYILLALFLGVFGAQEFYARHYKAGILCVLFCWTGIPELYSLVKLIIALAKQSDANGFIPM